LIKRIFIFISLGFLITSLFFTGCGNSPIKVGSFPDPEGRLLAQMIIRVLDENGFDVVDMGTYEDARKALADGDIDIFPEYTEYFEHPQDRYSSYYPKDENYYEEKQKVRLCAVMLQPAPADSQWAIIISRNLYEQGITTMTQFSDYLKEAAENKEKEQITIICPPDFVEDENALPFFKDKYSLNITNSQIRISASYSFTDMWEQVQDPNNPINTSVAYRTGPDPGKYELKFLEDNEQIYQRNNKTFHPAPVINKETYDKINKDQINRILTPLFSSLDDETLKSLNSQVGVTGKEVKAISEVARQYLVKNGYFKFNELEMVQRAMNKLSVNITDIKTSSTSNMGEFPSKEKHLYEDKWEDKQAEIYDNIKLQWPPLTWSETQGSYSYTNSRVIQETTGW
jgi:glycine betaine/choline ABC-type transport system substrate-binding protein